MLLRDIIADQPPPDADAPALADAGDVQTSTCRDCGASLLPWDAPHASQTLEIEDRGGRWTEDFLALGGWRLNTVEGLGGGASIHFAPLCRGCYDCAGGELIPNREMARGRAKAARYTACGRPDGRKRSAA